MKSSQLFLGFAIAFLMMAFSADAAKQCLLQKIKTKIETSNQTLVYGVLPTGQPAGGSDNSNLPEIKAVTSPSNLPTAFHIRSNQEIIRLFEIQFEELTFEEYQPSTPVALNRFFLHLFTVVISPNAP
ncbi:MAG TPA: hypothetical protein VFZ52_19740 [Chryseolinea sp.]